MIHDWVYENRAIYLTELTKVGGQVQLLDPHRVMIDRPDAEVARRRGRCARRRCARASSSCSRCSPRPGTSVLRNVYVINRGYEDLAERLNALGATIEIFRDI